MLDYAASRGLYVEITAITGSATGFNLISHMQAVNALAIDYENVVVEVSNEPYHASQRAEVHDPSFLRRLSEIIDDDVPVALGAPADDESDEMAAGDYVTVHLDRGRDKWNMIRRVRELEALSSRLSKFVLNNEPKKAGSQESDPAIYFAQGVLERVFEIGGVLHSDWGLAARTPNNAEQAITDAYIRGATLIPSDGPWMTFKNASWGDSPIRSFDGAVRVYSGLSASANIAVALGLESGFRMETQNGWRVGEILAEMPGVRVYALER